MYQYSTQSEFLDEIQNAGFEIIRSGQFEIGEAKDDKPFAAGQLSLKRKENLYDRTIQNLIARSSQAMTGLKGTPRIGRHRLYVTKFICKSFKPC